MGVRSSLPATLDHLRDFEGGYVNDPQDPGGCTKYGITLGAWRADGHPHATCRAIARLRWTDAASLYTRTYWAGIQGDRLPDGVDLLICDHGVNAGIGRAARLLQAAVGAAVDGDIGPKTIAAAEKAMHPSGKATLEAIAVARREYYRRLSGFKRYGKGWLRRVDAAEQAALLLAGELF